MLLSAYRVATCYIPSTVIVDGRKQFLGRPFVIPILLSPFFLLFLPLIRGTQSGPLFILGPEHLDIVRTPAWSLEILLKRHLQFNEPTPLNDALQLQYTMDASNRKSISSHGVAHSHWLGCHSTFIPEILESIMAMDAIGLPVLICTQYFLWRPLYNAPTVQNLGSPLFLKPWLGLTWLPKLAIFGTKLCRNRDYNCSRYDFTLAPCTVAKVVDLLEPRATCLTYALFYVKDFRWEEKALEVHRSIIG